MSLLRQISRSIPNHQNCLYGTFISAWSSVPLGPRDPILGITEAFKADSSPVKVNLGVGAYRDDKGKPYVLECVQKAEKLLPEIYGNKEYIGISGLDEFNEAAKNLAYGSDLQNSLEYAVCQSISGTGALRVGGDFLARFGKNKLIYVPTPTWGNHNAIFRDSGLKVESYRYWNPKTNGLNLSGMLEDIRAAPAESVILLHACAHNPTGVDPTSEQWNEILDAVVSKNHTAFFDMAYQGFATGDVDRDAYALRQFTKNGKVPILLAQSFAKNFGLYGERIGALSIPCSTAAEKDSVLSQLKIVARPMYSSPPIHGARLVATILRNQELRSLWFSEVKKMADRIIAMRHDLKAELVAHGSTQNWSHITSQIGMFCYTGLLPDQVSRLTSDFHIYLTKDGRISMAGINSSNIKHVASAMHQVTK